jgi:hypothetical protein
MDQLNLYNTIYQIYLNNLNFLESKFPQVFEKIVILSDAIETNQHTSRYELEFQEKEGCFNIYDTKNEKYIYNENSYNFSDKITQSHNLGKENTFSLLMLGKNNKSLSLDTYVKELNPLKKIINESIDFTNYEYVKIYKYLFMGTGLGIHIDSMVKKFNPNSILIVEPSIEIFRLSMFVTDYQTIAQSTRIYLSVAEARQERNLTTQFFYKYQPYLNYVVKYHLFNEDYNNVLSDIYKLMVTNHSENFSYIPQLFGIERTIKRVQEKSKFLDLKEIRTSTLFQDKPILILGAGPSARKSIDWIKNAQDKFYIVAVNTLLPLLVKENIKPDLLSVIDYEDITEKFFEDENLKEFLKDTVIVMPTQVSETVLDKLDRKNIYFLQTYNIYDELSPAFMVSNVGGFLIQFMGIVKANYVYCLGIDAAFDQISGALHSTNKVIERSVDVEITEDKIKVKGNLEDFVYTTEELLGYKNDFEAVSLMFKGEKNYKFYNLSHGAYIEGFEPLKIEEINLKEFPLLQKDDIQNLYVKSFIYADVKDFSMDLEKLDEMKKILKNVKKIRFRSRNHFLEEQIKLILSLIDISKEMSTQIFAVILMEFIELSGIYLYFFINVKGKHLENQLKLNNINVKWSNSAIQMLDEMQKCFKG